MIDDAHETQPAIEQRKKMLIAQGVLYRLAVGESRDMVRANLQVDALAKSAISHLVANASGAFGNLLRLKNFRNANAQTLLPVLISSISFLSKRRTLIKPVIVGMVTLAAVGTLAFFMSRRKNRTQFGNADADQANHRGP